MAAATVTPPSTITPAQQAAMQSQAQQEAQAQAESEIAGQVAPLQGQITGLTAQGQQQDQALSSEFEQSLLPAAQSEAQQTAAFNQNAQGAEQQIFSQATQNLNNLYQNQAAEAQRVAQQTGGPVSTGQFTTGITPYQTADIQSGAVNQLTSLNLGTLGTNEAQAFAGQVLPAMESEQRASAANKIADQIAALKTQIATIQGTKNQLIDAKLPALLQAKQDFALQQAQLALKRLEDSKAWAAQKRSLDQRDASLALDKTKTQHAWTATQAGIAATKAATKLAGKKAAQAWQATQQSLGLETKKLNLAQQAQTFSEGMATKTFGLDKTKLALTAQQLQQEGRRLTDQEKQAADRSNLSWAEYALRTHQYDVSDNISKQRIALQAQKNAMSTIDMVLGGKDSTKPETLTVKKVLGPDNPEVQAAMGFLPGSGKKAPTNIYHDPKTGQWYTYVKETYTPAQWQQKFGTPQHGIGSESVPSGVGTGLTDPNQVLTVLQRAVPGMNEKFYVNLIRTRMGIPDWNPGQPAAYTPQTLSTLDIGKLTDIAVGRGFKPSPLKTSKQALIDFIIHHG